MLLFGSKSILVLNACRLATNQGMKKDKKLDPNNETKIEGEGEECDKLWVKLRKREENYYNNRIR